MAAILFLLLIGLYFSSGGAVFTIKNSCDVPVWPGIQPNAGKPILLDGGFFLNPGEAVDVPAPDDWAGRFWGRTDCAFGEDGRLVCATGDCGQLHCSGIGGKPPATLAEFTTTESIDYYDVSLVDGYNLPVTIEPDGDGPDGECERAGCTADVNGICPTELQVKVMGKVVACRSACLAFGEPHFCCTAEYNSAGTCRPSAYSALFKGACPRAYSYAFDDSSSLHTCKAQRYIISFC